MAQDKLVEAMNDARLLAACDNLIFPLIEQRISDRLNVACANYRAGKTDFLADIAYVTGLQDIKAELQRVQTVGNKAIEKLQGN